MRFPRLSHTHPKHACAWLLLALSALSLAPCHAQGHSAAHPLYTTRLRRLVEMIPGSPTNLPMFLAGPRDLYLLVTAGGAYTDIEVLANPSVPPQTVASALEAAAAATPLRGSSVEWSGDAYSVAHLAVSHGHVGLTRSANTVPTAALLVGLRSAGWTPHLLLRVPSYTQTPGLPRSDYGTRTFLWYDTARLGSRSSVTVNARMTWITLARLLGFFFVSPLICLLGLAVATTRSRRPADKDLQRQAFLSVTHSTFIVAVMAQMGAMFYLLLQTPTLAVLADLWLGSGSTANMVPFLVAGVLLPTLFQVGMHRRAVRLFGKAPVAPAIPMSEEETTLRKRLALAQALPHILITVAVAVLPIVVPRTSPLYPILHPLAIFLPLAATFLLAHIFKKRLSRFTQTTVDDALTWRARELGQALNVRLADVMVEDSARAAHLASASHQKNVITLSRKLTTTFTPAETDFVLAHHLALMKTKRGGGGAGLRSLMLLPVMMVSLVPFVFLLTPSHKLGSIALSSLILSPWFLPVIIGYFGISLVLTFAMSSVSAKANVKQVAAADRDALEVTGNLAAAESALDKLIADSPAALPAASKTAPLQEAARLHLRRAALLQSAQTLHFAPAPGTRSASPPDMPVFQAEKTDTGPLRAQPK